MVIFGFREAPGAPETLQKGGGEAPGPNEMATEAPGAAQTPKATDFRSLQNFRFSSKGAATHRLCRESLAGKPPRPRWEPPDSTNFTPGFLIPEFLAGRRSSLFRAFRPEIDPGTPLDRRGSPGTSICTKNQPRRPILRPFQKSAPETNSKAISLRFPVGQQNHVLKTQV